MLSAYVLINTEVNAMEHVFEALHQIPNVKEAHMLYGVYDIIAQIEAQSLRELKEVMMWKIRSLNKLKSSSTMIVMHNPTTPH